MNKTYCYGAFVFLILLFGFQTDNGFDTYCNQKYLFCIDYPKDFIPQGESYSKDGQIFISKDSLAEIRAYGMYVMDDSDKISDVFAVSIQGIKVSYKLIKDDRFIFSGINKDGKIVYKKTVQKTFYDEFVEGKLDTTEMFQTLMITYPQTQKNIYKAYCDKIAKSFKN